MFHLDFMNLLMGGVFWLKVVTKGILVEHCFSVSVNVSDLDLLLVLSLCSSMIFSLYPLAMSKFFLALVIVSTVGCL